MKIDIVTLFPQMFEGVFGESIVKRAKEKNIVEIKTHDLRRYGLGKHRSVDDKPYGGGAGMVLMIEPIFNLLNEIRTKKSRVILMSPQGNTFNQQKAKKLTNEKHLILICGHYEGFDERIRQHLIDEEVSIGSYVLTGGELPAMVVTDAIVRLLPGVLGNDESTKHESHSKKGYLEHPHYTRPEEFNNWRVPDVLLSGNHAEIEKWREDNERKR